MKRHVAATVAVLSAVALLSGCAASDVAPATPAAVAASTATPVPAAAPAPPAPVTAPAGVYLPDPTLTPGATNPAVRQATIASTICVAGYTATIRPPSSVTTGLKRQQLASGYALNGDQNTRDYEEDHLISLELGGSPDSPQNLCPEPYTGNGGARVKDKVENKLHDLVCNGTLPLATAQQAIATDWWAAYQKYVG